MHGQCNINERQEPPTIIIGIKNFHPTSDDTHSFQSFRDQFSWPDPPPRAFPGTFTPLQLLKSSRLALVVQPKLIDDLYHRSNYLETFGDVASSTKYTRPRKLMPEWFARLISQVREVEYPSVQSDGSCRCCRADPVSSGYRIPLSPAIPATPHATHEHPPFFLYWRNKGAQGAA